MSFIVVYMWKNTILFEIKYLVKHDEAGTSFEIVKELFPFSNQERVNNLVKREQHSKLEGKLLPEKSSVQK
jgi:hypothetical protein